jgi:hypothetical protein
MRAGSTNAAVLQTFAAVAPDQVIATVYDGLGELAHFNPDDDRDPLPPTVAALRAANEPPRLFMFGERLTRTVDTPDRNLRLQS